MNAAELKEKIQKLSIWKRGDQRAPHKPLLILYALGRIQAVGSRFLSYSEARDKINHEVSFMPVIRPNLHKREKAG